MIHQRSMPASQPPAAGDTCCGGATAEEPAIVATVYVNDGSHTIERSASDDSERARP